MLTNCYFCISLLFFVRNKDAMLLFGHIGIALGASALLTNAISGSRFYKPDSKKVTEPSSPSSQVNAAKGELISSKASWFTSLGNRMDIRLLLLGSMLPDIIDKPMGIYFFREELSNGRIFTHTLLFLILTTIAGYYLYRRWGKTHLLAISLGIFTHLILDQMWLAPKTLFWPVLGPGFDRADVSGWISNILHALVTEPEMYVPELVGLIILAWFAVTLVRKRTILRFLKSGQVQ